MQNVAATSNKRSMKNNQNPATAYHTIMTARRPDNIRSSILVRGQSIRSMTRSGRQPRSDWPERIHIFAILAGIYQWIDKQNMKLDIKCNTEWLKRRCLMKNNRRRPDFLIKQSAPQARLIKPWQNAPQATFCDWIFNSSLSYCYSMWFIFFKSQLRILFF